MQHPDPAAWHDEDMSLRTVLAAAAVLLVVVVGGIVVLSGDDEPARKTTSAPSESATATAPAARKAAPRRSAARREVQQKRASRATVTTAYKGLDRIARSWYAGTYANVAAGLQSAQQDEGLAQFCGLMSRDARREAVAYARATGDVGGLQWTCRSAVALLVRRANQSGTADRMLRARVVGVNLEGNRGTATVDFGKGPQSTIALVKEDGAWKLGSGP